LPAPCRSCGCRPSPTRLVPPGRVRLSGSLLPIPALRAAGMDEQPQHPAIRGLKTVCRCNNIKYRTIERAIREGAHTLTQVANRTTATLGQCGGTCTPDVQAMLDELVPLYAKTTAPPKPAAAPADAWWVRKK
jgi:bacterioferritin-associated ferredoxin